MSVRCLFVLGFLCIAFLVPNAQVSAGNLARLRDTIRDTSPPRRGPKATRDARGQDRDDEAQDAEEPEDKGRDEKDRTDSRKAARESGKQASRAGALANLVQRTRREQEPRRPHAAEGSARRRAPRRRGGPFWGDPRPVAPAFGPTIVEHHYYATEPLIVEATWPGQHLGEEPLPPPVPLPIDCDDATGEPTFDLATSDELLFLPAWHASLGVDYGHVSDDVTRLGFKLLASQTAGLGVDSGIHLFREQSPDARDHLWLGDFNLTFEVFPTDYVRPRVGVGLNWLADAIGAEAGLNLTCGADVFLGPRVTVSGEVDFGTLGDADLFHGRVTAGFRSHDHWEWFAGFDHLDVGGAKLEGFVGGVRWRY